MVDAMTQIKEYHATTREAHIFRVDYGRIRSNGWPALVAEDTPLLQRRGRPLTALDEAVILRLLDKGFTRRQVALMEGCSVNGIRDLVKRAKDADDLHVAG